jgi:hypothetical protein
VTSKRFYQYFRLCRKIGQGFSNERTAVACLR